MFTFLYDANFSQCFDKTLTLMFLMWFEKTQNIVLTMHIGNVFPTVKKGYSRVTFLPEYPDFVKALKAIPKT